MFRSSQIRLISAGIKNFLDTVPERMRFLTNLRRDWTRIAGENCARHSVPASLRGNILIVHVDDPGWVAEFALLQDDFRDNVRNFYRDEKVNKLFDRIKFVTGRIDYFPEDETEKDPGLKIDPEKLKTIEKTVSGIEDKDLRGALRKFLVQANLEKRN